MRVRENMNKTYWYDTCDSRDPEPIEDPRQLIVAIDPSKTNMAVLIGTVTKIPLRIYEFSGNDPKFYNRAGDTADFCDEVDDFLTKVLLTSNVYVFGQEEIINKDIKRMKNSAAFAFMQSQKVLTEIRARLVNLARQISKKNPMEINNMAWKGAQLPEGYRGDEVWFNGRQVKGSYKFFKERFPQFNWTDDVTDVFCIYNYLCDKINKDVYICCDSPETTKSKYTLSLKSRDKVHEKFRYFQYNPAYSIEQNVAYYLNRCAIPGACEINIRELITPEMLHSMFTDNSTIPGEKVFLTITPNGYNTH